LLDATTSYPLSADVAVWPSAEDDSQAPQIFYDYNITSNGLNLFNLRENCDRSFIIRNANESIVIAIGFSSDDARHLIGKHKIDFSIANNEIENNKLFLLGFDVCNSWLLSGLMNYGIDYYKHKKLKEIFGQSLNRYGLFCSFDIAVNFSAEINNIASGHAPFLPSGLFVFCPNLSLS